MPKINLKNAPLLAAVIPLMAGIAIFDLLPRPFPAAFWICSAVIIVATILADVLLKRTLPLVAAGFLFLGIAAAWIDHREPDIPAGQRLRFVSRVETAPVVKGRWQNTQSQILAYKDTILGWQPTGDKTLLSVDTSQKVAVGQTLAYEARLYPIDSSYGRYMAVKGVYSRSYAYRVEVLGGDTIPMERIDISRHILAGKLNAIDSSGLAAALTMDDKRTLDRALRKDYSRTGAAHLLTVSGLHVGIIFTILNIILGWLRIYRRGLIVVGCLVIVILWGYALMTGMSPPVLRAVIMFTLFQIGIMASRTGSSLNILAASALFILLCDPSNLFDISFQMSYTAMVGITTLYRPLYSLLDPKSWPLRWLWGLTAVTIAAQIGVMPLVVYYFGQLQLAGVFINPIVWFTVPVIIVGGFAFLAVGWDWIGSVVGWTSGLQNSIISWTASHKWIAIEGIHMPQWALWVTYAVIVAVIIIVDRSQRRRHKTISSYFLWVKNSILFFCGQN